MNEATVELVAQAQARRLDLPALTLEGVRALLADVRSAPAGDRDAAETLADSGGNPWLVEALARGSGAISAAHDRIQIRLGRLEHDVPGAFSVLSALAAATRPIPYEAVAKLCGGDTPALRRILRLLRDAGIFEEVDEAWRFRQELTRRSVLESMISADRRDAHRALAEVLEGEGNAAELAMHFAAAADARALPWAMRAAKEASALSAHTESLAQYRRALSFDLEPEMRRSALRSAAAEAVYLGLYADGQRMSAEAALIPGGSPETVATLHLAASTAARLQGELAADAVHMAAAMDLLRGRELSSVQIQLAIARLAQSVMFLEPDEVQRRFEAASALVARVPEPLATLASVGLHGIAAMHAFDQGDQHAMGPVDEAIARAALRHPISAELSAMVMNLAYPAMVTGLLLGDAERLYARAVEAIRAHELGWAGLIQASRALELVQRGRYAEAEALAAGQRGAGPRSESYGKAVVAMILGKARAGQLEEALQVAASVGDLPPRAAAMVDIARLELASLARQPLLAELAAATYARLEPTHFARPAGFAAVVLAQAGGPAMTAPAWLPKDSNLRILWRWAAAVADRDVAGLREVAAHFAAIDCPYEAAVALRDAGDLDEAYRALRALNATTLREQVADAMRREAIPIPRRTRAAVAEDGLTETEREVCRLVSEGLSNEAAAGRLTISVRTVETHLTNIYRKTGRKGRLALVTWWREFEQARPAAGS